ncbi:MAG: ABC transporter ATP-binding protein, partial [Pseudanabaenales cyanobacterium]|nr:ABC transporter ATP-binding protein [Pseudanabaenales cyanobacterium]
LYDLNQREGRTIVMVLHELNQACRYGDHLIAMKAGQVYAQGNPYQVMTENIVREVFGLDCQIVQDPVAGTPLCIPIGRKAAVKS